MPKTSLQPHGYPDNPAAKNFYSLTDAARLTRQRDPWLSLPLARCGEHVGRWSGTWLPEIGERVRIKFPEFGAGLVVAYFVESGCLGVEVVRDQANIDERNLLVFGAELAPIGLPSGEIGPFARPTFQEVQLPPAERPTPAAAIMTEAEAAALASYLAQRHPHRKSGWDVMPSGV